MNLLLGYQALVEQSSSRKLGREGLTSWLAWASQCNRLTSTSWEDASVINASLWRIGNDCAIFRVLWPPYKWQLFHYGAHTSNLLPIFGAQLEFVLDEASRLSRLYRGSTQGFRLGSDFPLPVGVVFFPNLPFMRVMLFPSFVLGNASGGSSAFLVPLFPFSPLLSLSLLSSPSPSFFHSLFLSFSFSLPLFSFSFSLPFSFALSFFFLFF